MARSTRPRKRYVPRYAPGHLLLPEQRDKIVLPVHAALAAIELGAGRRTNRDTVAAFVNIAGTLCVKCKTSPTERAAVEAGVNAVVAADRRFMAHGRWGLSGAEMAAIRLAITIGDHLLKRVNSAVLAACIDWIGSINERTPETLGTAQEPLAVAA